MTLAVANFESLNKRYPQRRTDNGFSWRVALLPFKEEDCLYEALDHATAWDSQANSKFHLPVPHGLKCHNRENSSPDTQVFAVVSPNSVWKEGGTTQNEITDDPSETLMMIELDLPNINWMSPDDITLSELVDLLERDGKLPSSHPDGVLMSFADVSVRCIPHSLVTPQFLRSIVSIDGDEEITFDQLR